jgi:nuclear cap-binding protein subunit 1
MMEIYEINRKEAARVLLDSARWFKPGTFRPKPGTMPPPPPQPDDPPPAGYQLELSVMEVSALFVLYLIYSLFDWQTIITNMLVLPTSQHRQIYYLHAVTEICKLSAATCGPAVGKSIRKLYRLLNDGLDVEVARKFSEWFSIHMSNFGYQWVWKEWCAVGQGLDSRLFFLGDV